MNARQAYAHTHRDLYAEWCSRIESGPSTPARRMEFAVLSANAPFGQAVRVWEDSLDSDPHKAMVANGMGLTTMKTRAIYEIRNAPDDYPKPVPDYYTYRDTTKHYGLAWSKLSFAACLIAPLESDIVCLDTHMVQQYNNYIPNGSWFKSRFNYRGMENRLRMEARRIEMAPFQYQWAVWDLQRGSQENHDFLWS